MIPETLQNFVYQESPSIYTKCFYVMNFLALLYLGISEFTGNHLQYSKFWNLGSKKSGGILLRSKVGMLILYTPSVLAGLSSFVLFPTAKIRVLMLKSAITLHFLKRDLEVLFLHKFSGFMVLDSVITISAAYFASAVSLIYFQHRTEGLSEPLIDLKYVGILVFLGGICGNFYYHLLLSRLRKKGDEGYKIPRGGLFNLVICPHYLFEIVTFIGISFISQTTLSYFCALGSAFYLLGRSYATRNWYLSKFEDFPKNVKALIPYVF
ncbi:Steroid reductase [Handroanthus impetiginosus]|uniref:Steroid reductase n=1 Tax=Handroanthus impetiginosus TaxID=429701 RepID=A0A2G9HSX4_9LAMI|nr:Steroid reductase [Handroanthus impetiginosus]